MGLPGFPWEAGGQMVVEPLGGTHRRRRELVLRRSRRKAASRPLTISITAHSVQHLKSMMN